VSIPRVAIEQAKHALGSLDQKRVLLLGTGKMGELSARDLLNIGTASICVINRTFEHAQQLANQLNGTAARFEDRWELMVEADIIMSSTDSPDTTLSREKAELLSRKRAGRPLVLVDLAMPRDIDPEVREVPGISLYNIDDLEKLLQHNAEELESAAAEAQAIVMSEALAFQRTLRAERVVPTIVALRRRLDEICRQELDSFKHECGPFSRDQDQMFRDVASRITRRIAGSLARELKEFPAAEEQDQLTEAVQKLFHLTPPQKALAGTRIEAGTLS